ncbi:helix-turn-helix domain-containing protein [Psychrobacter sp. I-STPA6b]|uniref:helix-turn-helix domain-containing protein n=1 Tax=Psychrobacter sp. I-STPA6b TaxID=2585718 RepID=UPI001D0C24E5|nr:helix-turn-helix domain-containing protein [Psychrobacter sp. I-STPA6b]
MEVTTPQSTDTVSNLEKSGSPHAFGATLRRAREQKKATLDEAADTLHILKRHLEALEAEDFSKLPQATFARGFAINYAKYLGLDPHDIAKAFDAAYPTHLKEASRSEINTPLKPLGTLQRDSRRLNLRINPLLILGAIALVVLAVFLLRTISNARQEVPAEGEEVVVVDDISGVEQIQGASLDNTATSLPAGTAATGAGSAVGVTTTAPVEEVQSGSTNNATQATLDFWVRGNTDISVTDATGKSLMSGNQSRGGYKISGVPPFQVQISKVSNVALNLNQEKVALTQYAQNNQANFSLSP